MFDFYFLLGNCRQQFVCLHVGCVTLQPLHYKPVCYRVVPVSRRHGKAARLRGGMCGGLLPREGDARAVFVRETHTAHQREVITSPR